MGSLGFFGILASLPIRTSWANNDVYLSMLDEMFRLVYFLQSSWVCTASLKTGLLEAYLAFNKWSLLVLDHRQPPEQPVVVNHQELRQWSRAPSFSLQCHSTNAAPLLQWKLQWLLIVSQTSLRMNLSHFVHPSNDMQNKGIVAKDHSHCHDINENEVFRYHLSQLTLFKSLKFLRWLYRIELQWG